MSISGPCFIGIVNFSFAINSVTYFHFIQRLTVIKSNLSLQQQCKIKCASRMKYGIAINEIILLLTQILPLRTIRNAYTPVGRICVSRQGRTKTYWLQPFVLLSIAFQPASRLNFESHASDAWAANNKAIQRKGVWRDAKTSSSRGFAARFRARGYMPCALVLLCDPARRPGITSCCSHCSILVLSLFGIKLNHSVKEIAWLCILSVFGWKNCVAAEGSVTWKNNGEDNYLLNDSSGTRLFFSRAFFGVTVKD